MFRFLSAHHDILPNMPWVPSTSINTVTNPNNRDPVREGRVGLRQQRGELLPLPDEDVEHTYWHHVEATQTVYLVRLKSGHYMFGGFGTRDGVRMSRQPFRHIGLDPFALIQGMSDSLYKAYLLETSAFENF